MKPSSLLAAILSVVVSLAGCAGAPGPGHDGSEDGPLAPPHLAEGNHWVQRMYHEDAPEDTLATIEYFVAAEDQLEISGESVDTYRMEIRSENRTVWLRVSDWAVVQTAEDGQPSPVDPACEAYPWPLTGSSEWDHDCARLGTSLGNTTVEPDEGFASRVTAEEEVDVPAGTFATIVVYSAPASNASQTIIQEYYAPEACFPAKVVVDNQGTTIVLDLIAFECGGE